MITSKRLIHSLAFVAICTSVAAQSSSLSINNTNSPFSRYGVGLLSDNGFGSNRAMGGVGYGLKNGRQINPLNPASYSQVDSLTFLFETGASMQISRFSENGSSKTANNSSFDYVTMQFRLARNLGLTAGLKPFSHVGYNVGSSEEITDNSGVSSTVTNSYYGTGGLNQVFLGLGYAPFNNLSVGFNISYLFGTISKGAAVTSDDFSESRQVGVMRTYDYKLDLGAQYSIWLDSQKERELTIGAVYSLGHTLNTESTKSVNSNTSKVDASLKLPHAFGLGLGYRNQKWAIGVDYSLQLWDQQYTDPISADSEYGSQPLLNRSRYAAGAEWVPDIYSKKYLHRIRYRFGAYYTTPYYKVLYNNRWTDGPKEYGVSAGFGLPIPVLLNRSMINVSLQYARTHAKNMLSDNTFRINIGITFNETWFKKWKVE